MAAQSQPRKVHAKAFIADFTRGFSDEELRRKYQLSPSDLTRLTGKLRKAGLLTQDEFGLRQENLKIRFGSPKGPPEHTDEDSPPIETDNGLVVYCPSCGAPVTKGASECEYCASPLDLAPKLKTVPCPHCFSANPAGSIFCNRCGSSLQEQTTEGEVFPDRLCPRCEIPMHGKIIGEFSVCECRRCSGFFIEHETFELMQANSRTVFSVTSNSDPPKSMAPEAVRYVRCPVCRNMMNRINFAKISGVIVDTCARHGIWFDRDDLGRIMDFISRGGINRARKRELEELKAAERRAESKTARVFFGDISFEL